MKTSTVTSDFTPEVELLTILRMSYKTGRKWRKLFMGCQSSTILLQIIELKSTKHITFLFEAEKRGGWVVKYGQVALIKFKRFSIIIVKINDAE